MKCHFCSEDAEVSCVAEGDFIKCPSCGWYVANHKWGYQPYWELKQSVLHLIAGYLHEMKEQKNLLINFFIFRNYIATSNTKKQYNKNNNFFYKHSITPYFIH